jgi:hypothetical protein
VATVKYPLIIKFLIELDSHSTRQYAHDFGKYAATFREEEYICIDELAKSVIWRQGPEFYENTIKMRQGMVAVFSPRAWPQDGPTAMRTCE